jgi:hypothetical protein
MYTVINVPFLVYVGVIEMSSTTSTPLTLPETSTTISSDDSSDSSVGGTSSTEESVSDPQGGSDGMYHNLKQTRVHLWLNLCVIVLDASSAWLWVHLTGI